MNDFDAFERSAWQGRAEIYDRGFARLTVRIAEPLLNSARVDARTRLLDIGCGPGPVTAAALGRGAEVTAVDADLDMMELVARRHPHATVRMAALPDLPFPDAEFDAVTGNFVINHVGDPAAAVAELHRVLRPGGRIALSCWLPRETPASLIFAQAVAAAGVPAPADVPAIRPFGPYMEAGPFAGLLTEAGFAGASADTLRWTHEVDPSSWWDDILAGTAMSGATIARQSAEVQAGIRAEYDKLVRDYLQDDGKAAFPAAALIAHATR